MPTRTGADLRAPPADRPAGAPTTHDRCRFGEFTLDRSRGSLTRGGTAVPLRPKAYALLVFLVDHAGRLVGKDALLAAVWPGVVVTDDSLTRCVSELRAALGDSEQRLIRNVPRRGYLFDTAVVPDEARWPGAAEPSVAGDGRSAGDELRAIETPDGGRSIEPSARRRSPPVRVLAFGFAAVALVGAAAGYWLSRGTAPERLSLVVLPFLALAGDADAAPLAAALTDDLTGALARLHGVRVVAASTAGAWRGRPVDARRIGSELGVRYAVEGSVQRAGSGLRVNARLIDAGTGAALWSDHDDGGGADRPGRQDAIVMRLATALDAELVRAHVERIAAADPRRLDAEDLALQCVAASRVQGGESGAPSYALCEQALQKDAGNVRALARLAAYHAERVSRGQSLDVAADLKTADGYATRALAANDRYPAAHCARAQVLEGQGRLREAVVAAERCLALGPSEAGAYRMLAIEHFFLAEPEKTLAYVERGTQLSPRDPQLSTFLLFKGWALMQQGRADEAVGWIRRAQAVSPHSPNIALALSVALVMSGDEPAGRREMARYLALPRSRALTLAQWNRRPPANDGFATFAARTSEALLRAGMPP